MKDFPGSALLRPVCWWLGCRCDNFTQTGYEAFVTGCTRCGAWDTSYPDQVGDTRHARFMERVRAFRARLFQPYPDPCQHCGWVGDHDPRCVDHDIPF